MLGVWVAVVRVVVERSVVDRVVVVQEYCEAYLD